MAERKIIKAIEVIKNYFILNKIKLNELILFGSNSTGRDTKESDIDLIVISDAFKNKNLFAKATKLIKKTNTSFDNLYYSTEQWENSDSLIISEAKKKGKLFIHRISDLLVKTEKVVLLQVHR